MEIKEIHKQYEKVVNEYLQYFCTKQELQFEQWIGGMVGGIACFGDVYYFSLTDIIYDINTKQPKEQILQWHIDSIEFNGSTINYISYCRGMRYEYIKKRK